MVYCIQTGLADGKQVGLGRGGGCAVVQGRMSRYPWHRFLATSSGNAVAGKWQGTDVSGPSVLASSASLLLCSMLISCYGQTVGDKSGKKLRSKHVFHKRDRATE